MKMQTNLSFDLEIIVFMHFSLLSLRSLSSGLKLAKSFILSCSVNISKNLSGFLGWRGGAFGLERHDGGTLKILGGSSGRVYPPGNFFKETPSGQCFSHNRNVLGFILY